MSRFPAFAVLLLLVVGITAYRAWVVANNGLNLYVDEAQYWYWAQNLAWGYYSKPPVIAAIIALTTGLCGDAEVCVRLGSLLFYPLSTLVVFFLARRLFDDKVALLAALLFFTLPAVSLSSTLISTDVALFFFWTLALYAFVKVLDSNAWRDWLLLGVALGLGMLSKYTMGIFFVSALLYIVVARRWDVLFNARAWLTVLLAALLFAPNLYWNWQHDFPTFQHTADIAQGGQGWHWDELIEFVGGQLGVFGIILFPLFAWLVLRARIPHKALLVSFALPFLVIIMLQALMGRANANWAAPSYVAATLLVAAWFFQPVDGWARGLRGQKLHLLAFALLLNIGLGVLAYHPALLNHLLNTDLHKRLKGWDEIATQYQQIQQQYPQARLLAESRDILSGFAYYTRPQGLQAVSWNPQQQLRHHYDLVTRLDDKAGEDFLMVVKGKLPVEMAKYFSQVKPVGHLHVPIHASYQLDFKVYFLKNFQRDEAGAQ